MYVFLSLCFRRLPRALPQLPRKGYLWEGNEYVSRPLNMARVPTPLKVADCGGPPAPVGAVASRDGFSTYVDARIPFVYNTVINKTVRPFYSP